MTKTTSTMTRAVHRAKKSALQSPKQMGSKYAVAKIALLGDAGVGKTALGWCLAGGRFTAHPTNHPLQFFILSDLSKALSDGTQRDAVIWDMASHPDYRLIHPLSTADANLALIVFDPTVRPDPLRPVTYWLEHLTASRKKRCPAILVAARSEVGAPALTKKDFQGFCKKNGVLGRYVTTSAATGDGIPELRNRIKSLLNSAGVRSAAVASHFNTIKNSLLHVKEKKLRSSSVFSAQQLLNHLQKVGLSGVTTEELLEAVPQLANYGYVRLVGVSETETRILISPELFDGLAASFVRVARQHPQGLGVLEEDRVLANDFAFPELRGLSAADQKLMLRSVVLAFLERNLTLRCLREVVGQKSLLFFPDLVSTKRPKLNDTRVFQDGASYTVKGDIDYLFSVLVVSLGYTNMFLKADHWQDSARYEMHDGLICGFRIEDERDAELDLVLFFDGAADQTTRTVFRGLVESFLVRRNLSFRRYDPVYCGDCNHQIDRKTVRNRLIDLKDWAHCTNCGASLSLQAPVESSGLTQTERRKVDVQEWFANQRSLFEQVVFGVKGYAGAMRLLRPDCFISYAWGNKEQEGWVEHSLATDLQKAGINILLDRWENAQLGKNVTRFIAQIEKCHRVIVVGTPLYRRKYENKETTTGFILAAEVDLISSRMLGTEADKESVLPLLLAGGEKTALPPLLQRRVRADFRNERDYFKTAFDLILDIYGISHDNPAVADLRKSLRESERP